MPSERYKRAVEEVKERDRCALDAMKRYKEMKQKERTNTTNVKYQRGDYLMDARERNIDKNGMVEYLGTTGEERTWVADWKEFFNE